MGRHGGMGPARPAGNRAGRPGEQGGGGSRGGGAGAAPEAGRREGRGGGEGPGGRDGRRPGSRGGETRASSKRRQAGRRGDPQPRTVREGSWEGSQARCRERTGKGTDEGAEQAEGASRRESKSSCLRIPTRLETEEQILGEERGETSPEQQALGQQPRRPTISFSICPKSRRQSKWSHVGCRSGSVVNELAKMGDPDVVEMVQEEGKSGRSRARTAPSQAQGPQGPLSAPRPGFLGRSRSGVPCETHGPCLGWGG